jgi:hypothetical protein
MIIAQKSYSEQSASLATPGIPPHVPRFRAQMAARDVNVGFTPLGLRRVLREKTPERLVLAFTLSRRNRIGSPPCVGALQRHFGEPELRADVIEAETTATGGG